MFDVFPTGMTREPGEALSGMIRAESASNFLEIGLGLGLSTVFLAQGVLSNHAKVQGLSMDPFQFRDWDGVGLETVRRAGLSESVGFEMELSERVLPELWQAGRRFDFIFIDGGHLFENVIFDTFYAVRLVRPGGLIVLDDRWMPSVQRGVAYFTANVGLLDESAPKGSPGHRFVTLRVPPELPQRKWDHFVPF